MGHSRSGRSTMIDAVTDGECRLITFLLRADKWLIEQPEVSRCANVASPDRRGRQGLTGARSASQNQGARRYAGHFRPTSRHWENCSSPSLHPSWLLQHLRTGSRASFETSRLASSTAKQPDHVPSRYSAILEGAQRSRTVPLGRLGQRTSEYLLLIAIAIRVISRQQSTAPREPSGKLLPIKRRPHMIQSR